jgi:hypothetical protein
MQGILRSHSSPKVAATYSRHDKENRQDYNDKLELLERYQVSFLSGAWSFKRVADKSNLPRATRSV